MTPIQQAELLIKANFRNMNLRGTPAEAILCRPGHEVWQAGGNELNMARQISVNTHWYGLNGAQAWTWDAGSGANNNGEALARGTTNMTNCGGFNLTARWIGIQAAGLSAEQFKGSYTTANDFFITSPGTVGIDRNWIGNVRTITGSFAAIRAYFFKGHSWSKYGNVMLDASTNNMDFHSKLDLYWCALNLVHDKTGRVFLVSMQRTAIPGTAPYCAVSHTALRNNKHHFPIVLTGAPGQGLVTQGFISQMPTTTGHGWETFLLASCSQLPQAFRNAVTLP